MITALSSFVALMLAAQSSAQTTVVSDFVSPCPNVFSYDPLAIECEGEVVGKRWYGTVNLITDTPLYALWLNIVLDGKANILGNCLGEVTTNDNIDFKIEKAQMMITPDKPQPVRFFVQYKEGATPPKLKSIRFNGKEICQVKPQRTTPTSKPNQTPNYFYTQANNNQQVTSTDKPTNQIRIGNARTTTEQVQSWPYIQTSDRNRTVNPVWLNVASNENVSSTATRKNNFQIEVKQVGNTKYWSKIPENTTGAPVKVPSGHENISNGWTGNEQRFADGGLQKQPDANIKSIKQAESTQNLNQPRDTPLYVRPGERQSMSDNRYKPENNLDVVKPQNSVQSYQPWVEPARNGMAIQSAKPENNLDVVRPQNNVQPWVEPARNGMVIQSGVDPSRYPTNDGRIKNFDGSSLSFDRFQTTTVAPVPVPNKIEDSKQAGPYYPGGLPVFYIPNVGSQNIAEPTCGKVLLNKGTAQNLQSTRTLEGQWPWLTAIYQQQDSVDLHYKYVCGGTLVSRRHVVTAAHCVAKQSSARPVNMDTLLVFMGKHNLRTTVEGVERKFVYKILIYPEYDPTIYRKDLAILTLRDPVTFTNKIQPICLWPEQETDLQYVVGETGSTVGWGYDVTGALTPRENQILLQMEVISQQTCLITYADFFRFDSDKTFCAAYRNSGGTCNGDSGGGMVFQKGGSWYLRGVVSLSIARQGTYQCDANHHVIFTDVAKFRPWIQDNIGDI